MSRAGVLALALGIAACGGDHAPAPVTPVTPVVVDAPDAGTGLEPDRPDVPEVPEDERIAAIELAMNQLAPVANQCWAAAAADDYRLAGDVRALITVGRAAGPGAAVEFTADTTDDEVLATCLEEVLGAYAWAPPLAGQAVELPFHFTAPAMQNVIDRRYVPRHAQAGAALAVLLDEVNTGNPALSMVEVTVAAGAALGPRQVERLEVWRFLAPATVASAGAATVTLAAGDVLIAPPEARLELRGSGGPLAAVVVLAPGGREGAARAGALPGRATTMAVRARPPQPVVVTAVKARRYPRPGGATTILVEAPLAGGKVSVGQLEMDAGVSVPAHVHARETEALYVLSGGGTMTIAGVAVPVTEHSVIQIPAGVEHAFVATAATTSIQLYTPAGPEQRFKKPPPAAPTR